jgi:phosphopantetheinyl transferase (holo-ACP synthase)
LPYVGNDVVDLKEPANAGKSGDSRFLKKILTDAEIKFVKNADNPDTALWSLWACKETAYKAIKKSFPDTAFVPRRWQTVFTNTNLQSKVSRGGKEEATQAYSNIRRGADDAANKGRRMNASWYKSQSEYSDGKVIIPGKEIIFIRLFPHSQYVHCVGADNVKVLDKLIWSVEALPEEKNINPSIYLRHLLRQNLARCFSLNFNQIKIKRTRQNGELQPPYVYIDGRKTDIDISLSHDGRFVAYAALLPLS